MLLKTDFNTHMYPELIDAIDREDDEILNAAIAAAEQQAKGYLTRYDYTTLFNKGGEFRDPMLMVALKDLAIWHFVILGNPDTDMQVRKTRYDEALVWLKDIQAGKIWYPEWPLPAPDEGENGGVFQVNSQPKRETRY